MFEGGKKVLWLNYVAKNTIIIGKSGLPKKNGSKGEHTRAREEKKGSGTVTSTQKNTAKKRW